MPQRIEINSHVVQRRVEKSIVIKVPQLSSECILYKYLSVALITLWLKFPKLGNKVCLNSGPDTGEAGGALQREMALHRGLNDFLCIYFDF